MVSTVVLQPDSEVFVVFVVVVVFVIVVVALAAILFIGVIMHFPAPTELLSH